jgi:deoxyribonuclease I
MKRGLLLLVLTLACMALTAQDITFNPSQASFGNVTVGGAVETLNLTVSNPNSYTLHLDFSTDSGAFSVSPESVTLSPGQQSTAVISFQGTQNVHCAALLVATDPSRSLCRMVPVSANAHDAETYYDLTYNQYDQSLITTLHGMIDNQDPLGYTGAKEEMFGYIDNVNGQVMCVYTGVNYAVAQGGMPDQNVFNTEHTWPQSMFDTISEESTAKCDLHHLYPTFADINNTRANYPFGEVVSPDGSDGGSSWGDNSSGIHVFEPRDAHKGDCARSMFYFSVRYDNPENFINAQESTLRQWFDADPVSTKEINRNNAIDDAQGNRNPFVDRPALLARIYSISTGSAHPQTPSLLCPLSSLNLGAVLPNGSVSRNLFIANSGEGALNVQSATSNNNAFTVGSFDTQLSTQETVAIPISFSGSQLGPYSANLTLATNDGTISIPLSATVSTDDIEDQTLPLGLCIGPNPFHAGQEGMSFSIAAPGRTDYALYSIRGERIRHWNAEGSIRWNGLDEHGHPIAPGVYLLKIQHEARAISRKIIVLP